MEFDISQPLIVDGAVKITYNANRGCSLVITNTLTGDTHSIPAGGSIVINISGTYSFQEVSIGTNCPDGSCESTTYVESVVLGEIPPIQIDQPEALVSGATQCRKVTDAVSLGIDGIENGDKLTVVEFVTYDPDDGTPVVAYYSVTDSETGQSYGMVAAPVDWGSTTTECDDRCGCSKSENIFYVKNPNYGISLFGAIRSYYSQDPLGTAQSGLVRWNVTSNSYDYLHLEDYVRSTSPSIKASIFNGTGYISDENIAFGFYDSSDKSTAPITDQVLYYNVNDGSSVLLDLDYLDVNSQPLSLSAFFAIAGTYIKSDDKILVVNNSDVDGKQGVWFEIERSTSQSTLKELDTLPLPIQLKSVGSTNDGSTSIFVQIDYRLYLIPSDDIFSGSIVDYEDYYVGSFPASLGSPRGAIGFDVNKGRLYSSFGSPTNGLVEVDPSSTINGEFEIINTYPSPESEFDVNEIFELTTVLTDPNQCLTYKQYVCHCNGETTSTIYQIIDGIEQGEIVELPENAETYSECPKAEEVTVKSSSQKIVCYAKNAGDEYFDPESGEIVVYPGPDINEEVIEETITYTDGSVSVNYYLSGEAFQPESPDFIQECSNDELITGSEFCRIVSDSVVLGVAGASNGDELMVLEIFQTDEPNDPVLTYYSFSNKNSGVNYGVYAIGDVDIENGTVPCPSGSISLDFEETVVGCVYLIADDSLIGKAIRVVTKTSDEEGAELSSVESYKVFDNGLTTNFDSELHYIDDCNQCSVEVVV